MVESTGELRAQVRRVESNVVDSPPRDTMVLKETTQTLMPNKTLDNVDKIADNNKTKPNNMGKEFVKDMFIQNDSQTPLMDIAKRNNNDNNDNQDAIFRDGFGDKVFNKDSLYRHTDKDKIIAQELLGDKDIVWNKNKRVWTLHQRHYKAGTRGHYGGGRRKDRKQTLEMAALGMIQSRPKRKYTKKSAEFWAKRKGGIGMGE